MRSRSRPGPPRSRPRADQARLSSRESLVARTRPNPSSARPILGRPRAGRRHRPPSALPPHECAITRPGVRRSTEHVVETDPDHLGMTEALVAGSAAGHLISTALQPFGPGRRGIVLKANDWRLIGLPDAESGEIVATETPARRLDGLAGVLSGFQRPRQQLQHDLRLGIGPHGAEHRVESTVV